MEESHHIQLHANKHINLYQNQAKYLVKCINFNRLTTFYLHRVKSGFKNSGF